MNKKLIGLIMLIGQIGYMAAQWAFAAFQPYNIATWVTPVTLIALGTGSVWFLLALFLIKTGFARA